MILYCRPDGYNKPVKCLRNWILMFPEDSLIRKPKPVPPKNGTGEDRTDLARIG
jgi:hypothetical protein